MIVIPAIDILGGKVARLTRGDFSFEKTYDGTALDFAKRWEEAGAEWIHIVDLDGARTGEFKNLKLIARIASSVKPSVELGGGLRDMATIKAALKAGVRRVIIGTRAVDKDFVKEAVAGFGPEKIIAGVDSKKGKVAVSGWTETKDMTVEVFLRELESVGVKTIIFTDIEKDGMLSGPNFEALDAVIGATFMKVIASGGVTTIDDIVGLKELARRGLVGCIIGKALYEGRLDLREAIEVAS